MAGIAASLSIDASMWTDFNDSLLSIVAIVSAGVLVRLARVVPFSAVDALEAGEAVDLSAALNRASR